MSLRVHPEAESDFREAADYYRTRAGANVAEAFLAEFERALGVLGSRPLIGAAAAGTYRRLSMRRFPFSVFYVVLHEDVQVFAVAHHRRRPGYWHGRTFATKK